MTRSLSRVQTQERLARGDRLHMELRDGARLWWFEGPLAYVADKTIAGLLLGHDPGAVVMEAGDSLFGLPLNS